MRTRATEKMARGVFIHVMDSVWMLNAQCAPSGLTILIRHSRRSGTRAATIVFEFHKAVNCRIGRLLPASGLLGHLFDNKLVVICKTLAQPLIIKLHVLSGINIDSKCIISGRQVAPTLAMPKSVGGSGKCQIARFPRGSGENSRCVGGERCVTVKHR
jgi:hypothetical protein